MTSTAVRARRTQSSLSHDYDLRAGPSARLASSHVPLTQPGDARRGTRDAGTSTHGTSHVAVACLIHVEHLDNTAKLPQSETAYRDHVHHRSGPVTTQSMSSVCGLCLCGARLCCAVYAAAGRGVERASRATSAPPRSWSMAIGSRVEPGRAPKGYFYRNLLVLPGTYSLCALCVGSSHCAPVEPASSSTHHLGRASKHAHFRTFRLPTPRCPGGQQ